MILLWVAERSLRRDLEGDIARALESEAAPGARGAARRFGGLARSGPAAGARRPDIGLPSSIGRLGQGRQRFPAGPAPGDRESRPPARGPGRARGSATASPAGGARPSDGSCSMSPMPGGPGVVRVAAGLDQVDDIVRRAQQAVAGARAARPADRQRARARGRPLDRTAAGRDRFGRPGDRGGRTAPVSPLGHSRHRPPGAGAPRDAPPAGRPVRASCGGSRPRPRRWWSRWWRGSSRPTSGAGSSPRIRRPAGCWGTSPSERSARPAGAVPGQGRAGGGGRGAAGPGGAGPRARDGRPRLPDECAAAAVGRRRAGDARSHRDAPARGDAPRLRGQRVPRAQDPAHLDLGLRRDAADRYARPRDHPAVSLDHPRPTRAGCSGWWTTCSIWPGSRPAAGSRSGSRWTWPAAPGRPGTAAGRTPRGRVDFEVEVADGRRPRCYADADAMRQVLTNLLDNALRYTPPGGRIVCRSRPGDGGIAISVSDNGSGIVPRASAPDLRAVLPLRSVPLAGGGRHRAGARDRQAPGGGARRAGSRPRASGERAPRSPAGSPTSFKPPGRPIAGRRPRDSSGPVAPISRSQVSASAVRRAPRPSR